MKKHLHRLLPIAVMTALAAGCGEEEISSNQEEIVIEAETETEIVTWQEEELEEVFVSAEEAGDVPTVISEYAEEEEYPELAQFLADYYQLPEEQQIETRYYYNRIDLNEDGTEEIFAIVIGEYTKQDAGDPALLLTEENGTFTILESFAEVRTPVTISENITNGWHDIIFRVYGKGVEDGYLISRYNPEGGYQTEINELVTELEPMSATQILSNNLIDDLDQGRYFTLKK